MLMPKKNVTRSTHGYHVSDDLFRKFDDDVKALCDELNFSLGRPFERIMAWWLSASDEFKRELLLGDNCNPYPDHLRQMIREEIRAEAKAAQLKQAAKKKLGKAKT